jgi:hypothetical protein
MAMQVWFYRPIRTWSVLQRERLSAGGARGAWPRGPERQPRGEARAAGEPGGAGSPGGRVPGARSPCGLRREGQGRRGRGARTPGAMAGGSGVAVAGVLTAPPLPAASPWRLSWAPRAEGRDPEPAQGPGPGPGPAPTRAPESPRAAGGHGAQRTPRGRGAGGHWGCRTAAMRCPVESRNSAQKEPAALAPTSSCLFCIWGN